MAALFESSVTGLVGRRDALKALGSAGALGLVSSRLSGQTPKKGLRPFTDRGSGLALLVFDRQPNGFYDALTDRYRVVAIDATDTREDVASLSADRICADILAVADAAGLDRFAWFGFSWGAVVGLQLASRIGTGSASRLTALACGGWPPLGGQYAETLGYTEEQAAQGRRTSALPFYQSLRGWPEREAVSRITCPRLVFAGNKDEFVAGTATKMRIGPLVAEHRAELQRLGWRVEMIDGFGHELGGRPDVIMPILKQFLDPILLR